MNFKTSRLGSYNGGTGNNNNKKKSPRTRNKGGWGKRDFSQNPSDVLELHNGELLEGKEKILSLETAPRILGEV